MCIGIGIFFHKKKLYPNAMNCQGLLLGLSIPDGVVGDAELHCFIKYLVTKYLYDHWVGPSFQMLLVIRSMI